MQCKWCDKDIYQPKDYRGSIIYVCKPTGCWFLERLKMTDATTELLAERAKTHGSFEVHARTTQALKEVMIDELGKADKILGARHHEALDMILHKIGRIVAGNANFKDHWDDIAGYAKLGSEACEG